MWIVLRISRRGERLLGIHVKRPISPNNFQIESKLSAKDAQNPAPVPSTVPSPLGRVARSAGVRAAKLPRKTRKPPPPAPPPRPPPWGGGGEKRGGGGR